MNPSCKAIAVTLLAGVMTVGMTACSRELPDEPNAGAPQADVSIAQIPANDDFANAVAISTLPFTDNLNTSEATAVGDPANDCLVDGHTVWYQFTPSADMRINANTFGSDYDTGIAERGPGRKPYLRHHHRQQDLLLGRQCLRAAGRREHHQAVVAGQGGWAELTATAHHGDTELSTRWSGPGPYIPTHHRIPATAGGGSETTRRGPS
jgi:hypothetical protein